MNIERLVLDFLVQYTYILFPLLLGGLGLFAVANWSDNVYSRQNRKLKRCRKKITANPARLEKYIKRLPSEYRRQYRAYLNSGALLPSKTFEFVPLRNKLRLTRIFALTALMATSYAVAFAFGKVSQWYLLFETTFWLALIVVLFINRDIFAHKQKHARKVFGGFVSTLNKFATTNQQPSDKTTAQQLNTLKHEPCCDQTLSRAVELLRNNVAEDRTVEEQRQVNSALNTLLQNYAKTKTAK